MRRPGVIAALLACSVLVVACGGSAADEAVGDRLAERLVESLRERARDRHRRDLPLPADELLREVDGDLLRPNEGFRVDLVDDLVIGAWNDDVNRIFGRLGDAPFSLNRIAVDDAGRIFVLPVIGRATHVRVFGADGEHLYRFARWGEGPGDLLYPRGLIVAGERVLVFHRNNTQWSIWERTGTYRGDRQVFPAVAREALHRVKVSKRVLAAYGLDDGSVVAMSPGIQLAEIRNPFATLRVAASRFDPHGNEARRFFEVPEKVQPRIAVSPGGEIYASFADPQGGDYHVVAWAADGSPRWFTALAPIDDTTGWAELRLDDAGHLFVMPVYRPLAPKDPRRPVHVLTTGGELIGSGYLNRSPERLHWQTARDGKVYGVRQSETTNEWEVVRYRVEISGPAPETPPWR